MARRRVINDGQKSGPQKRLLTKKQAKEEAKKRAKAAREKSNSDESSSEDEESTTEESPQVSTYLQAPHSEQLTNTTMIASSTSSMSMSAAAAAYPSHGGMMTTPAVTGLSSMGAAAAAAYQSNGGMMTAPFMMGLRPMGSAIAATAAYPSASQQKQNEYLYLLLADGDVEKMYEEVKVLSAGVTFLTFFVSKKSEEKQKKSFIFRSRHNRDEIWEDIGNSPCFFLGLEKADGRRHRRVIQRRLQGKTLKEIKNNGYQFFIPDSISKTDLRKLDQIAEKLTKRYAGQYEQHLSSKLTVYSLSCTVRKQDGTEEKMTLQELLDARLPKVTTVRADVANSFYVVSKMKSQSAILNPVCQQTLSTLFQLVDAQFVDNLSQFQEMLMYDRHHAFVGFSVSEADKEVAIKQLRKNQLSFDDAIYYFPKEDDLTLEDLILLMRLQQVNIPELKIAIAKPDKTYELRSIKEMTLTIQSYQKTIIDRLPPSLERSLLTLFPQQNQVVAEQQQSLANTMQSSQAISTTASVTLFGGSSLSSNTAAAAAAAAAAPASSSTGP